MPPPSLTLLWPGLRHRLFGGFFCHRRYLYLALIYFEIACPRRSHKEKSPGAAQHQGSSKDFVCLDPYSLAYPSNVAVASVRPKDISGACNMTTLCVSIVFLLFG